MRHPIQHYLLCTFLWLFCLWANPSQAQETIQYDAVYFKDGTVILGQIMKYDPNGKLVLQLEDGSTVEYDAAQILKTKKETVVKEKITVVEREQKQTGPSLKDPLPQKYLYGWGAIGNVFSDRYGVLWPGFSLEFGLGHRFNHAFAIGAGGGITTEFWQSVAYIYGSVRGAFLKKAASPFYQVDIGYGNALGRYRLLVRPEAPGATVYKKSGGLYLHPSIGFRFASRNTVHTYLAAGCLIQYVNYQGINWNNFDFSENLPFIRPSLRVGIVF